MDNKNIEQKLKVLQFQNQNLSAQLEAQRKEIGSLQDKLSTYEKQQDEHAQTLLCVNRIWQQLNSDICFLSLKAAGQPVDAAPLPSDAQVDTENIHDPYLQKLLDVKRDGADPKAAQAADKQQQIKNQLSAAEKLLTARATRTQEALATLAECIRQEKEHNSALSAAIQASSADEQLKKDNQKLREENMALAQELDTMAALHRTAEDELQQVADRQTEFTEKLKKVQNELADKEEELTIIQKKYYALKTAGGDQSHPPRGGESSKGGDGKAPAEGSEAAELQQLLAKRTSELEKERDELAKAQKEVLEVKARMASDTYAVHSESYKAVKKEAAALREALAQRLQELEGMQRERDQAMRDKTAKTHESLGVNVLRVQLEDMQKQVRVLLAEKAELNRLKGELEGALQREREAAGQRGTVAELQAMLGALQKEVAMGRARGNRAQAAVEKLAKADSEIQEAVRKSAVAEAETARMVSRMKEVQTEVAESKGREEELKQRIMDLQAFVEVLTTFCDDDREVAQVRANEAALKLHVAHLNQELQGHELQKTVRELEEAALKRQRQVEEAQAEADALRGEVVGLQRQVGGLTSEVAAVQADSETLMNEIEVTAGAYEEMQVQNGRLLALLSERDGMNNQLVGERIKLNQQLAGLKEEAEAAKAEAERCTREAGELTALREQLNGELARLNGELAQSQEQVRTLTMTIEELKRSIADSEEAVTQLRAQLEGAEKLANEHKRALDEEIDRCAQERTKRQRLDEDNKALVSKVERLKKTQVVSQEVKEMSAEVEGMRKMLNCNVCHERRKDVIITKCWHMFCSHCIKRNLETRHRKCPGCGSAFGAADVKNFYFT